MKELSGVDFGTGGCKATVIDLEESILVSAFQEYPSEYKKPGWSEQNPALWTEVFIDTVTAYRTQMNDGLGGMLGLAITASTHNVVLLDGNGQVIRHCITRNSQRNGEQCRYLREKHREEVFKIGIQMSTPTWTLPQSQWVREGEPRNYKEIRRLVSTKDYIRSWVTGGFCVDIIDAQGNLFFDARKQCWSEELHNMAGLPVEVLPEIREAKEVVRTVREKASKQTDPPGGLPVMAGCSDAATENFSAGAVENGQIIIKLATAGDVNLATDRTVLHNKIFTYPCSVEGKWYIVTATNGCASTYRWMRGSLYSAEKKQCDRKGRDVYLLIDERAASVELDCQELLFHSYLLGERYPYFNPNAGGDFSEVSIVRKKGHFAKALLRSIAFSPHDCLRVLKKLMNNMESIVIIGGEAKSPLWCQIVSDIFGLEVKMPQNMESSFGGMLLAGVGVGVFADELEVAGKCIRMRKTYYPDMENYKKYTELFKIYKEIADIPGSVRRELVEPSA